LVEPRGIEPPNSIAASNALLPHESVSLPNSYNK
jgi:hypothetical protein